MINRMISIPNELDQLLKTERNASELITRQMLRYYGEQGVTADALKQLSVKLELLEREKQQTQLKLIEKQKETAEAEALQAELGAKKNIEIDAELAKEKQERVSSAYARREFEEIMNGKDYTMEDFMKWKKEKYGSK